MPFWPSLRAPFLFNPESWLRVIVPASLSPWPLASGLPTDLLPIKQSLQSLHDRTGVNCAYFQVAKSLPFTWHRASFFAATASHIGHWQRALPISPCGLRLDEEAVRVAVGIRLGLRLCEPHTCLCGAMVDARGLRSFVSTHAPRQNYQTPCSERRHLKSFLIYWHTRRLRTSRPHSPWRKKAWWSHPSTQIGRQTPDMRCNGGQDFGGLLWNRQRGRLGLQPSRQKSGKSKNIQR